MARRLYIFVATAIVLTGCAADDGGGEATAAAAKDAHADGAASAATIRDGDYSCLVLQSGSPTPAYAPSALVGFRFGPGTAFTHLATGGGSGTYTLDPVSMRVALRGARFDGWVAEYGLLSANPEKPFLRFRPATFGDPGPELQIDDVMCYGGAGP